VARDDVPSTRPLLDKLGVKSGQRISAMGLDQPFLDELRGRGAEVSARRRARSDQIFLALAEPADLRKIRTQRDFIVPNGAVWAIWPKGRKDINENTVRDAALEAGLVDVKVVAFSEKLSALKLVIRLRDR
jgi:hypothetical protein